MNPKLEHALRRDIQRRLVVIAVVPVAVMAVAVTLLLLQLRSTTIDRVEESRLSLATDVIATNLRATALGGMAQIDGRVDDVADATMVRDVAQSISGRLRDARVLVVDRGGVVRVDTGNEDAGVAFENLELGQAIGEWAPGVDGGQVRRDVAFGYAASARSGWLVVVSQPGDVAVASLDAVAQVGDDVARTIGQVIVLSLVLAAVLGGLSAARGAGAARAVAEPVEELRDAAAGLVGGDLETVMPVGREDELGDIGRSLERLQWVAKYVTGSHAASSPEMLARAGGGSDGWGS